MRSVVANFCLIVIVVFTQNDALAESDVETKTKDELNLLLMRLVQQEGTDKEKQK